MKRALKTPSPTGDDQEETPTADDETPAATREILPTPSPTPAPDLPGGIPSGSVPAKVAGHVDGDKIRVEVRGTTEEVLLIGVDAPELDEGPSGECYAREAAARLKKMLPKGRTIFLERDQDDRDSKDRLLRFIWFVGREDGKAYFANEIMLREGYSGFQPREQNARHDEVLSAAEEEAKDEDKGVWGECRSLHQEIVPTPTPSPIPTPTPTLDEIVANYPPLVDVRELAIRPGNLLGERISFSGTVTTIRVAGPGRVFELGDSDSKPYAGLLQVEVLAPDGTSEVVFVGYDGDTTGIFEGTFVTVYGTVVDTTTFENPLGGEVTQPLVSAVLVLLA